MTRIEVWRCPCLLCRHQDPAPICHQAATRTTASPGKTSPRTSATNNLKQFSAHSAATNQTGRSCCSYTWGYKHVMNSIVMPSISSSDEDDRYHHFLYHPHPRQDSEHPRLSSIISVWICIFFKAFKSQQIKMYLKHIFISKRFIMSICRWFSTVKAVKGATSQEFTNIFLCFIAAAGDEITPVLTLLLPRPIPSSTAAIQFKVYLTSMQNKCSLSASGNSGSSQWSSFHNQNPSTYTLSGAPQPVNAFYEVLVIFIYNLKFFC